MGICFPWGYSGGNWVRQLLFLMALCILCNALVLVIFVKKNINVKCRNRQRLHEQLVSQNCVLYCTVLDLCCVGWLFFGGAGEEPGGVVIVARRGTAAAVPAVCRAVAVEVQVQVQVQVVVVAVLLVL
jgi:hypothetical protein